MIKDSPAKIKVALIQQSCLGSISENQAKSAQMIREASQNGAELILLPELHSSFYFCQKEDPTYFALAESIPGPTTEFFGRLADELKVVLVISLFERRLSGLYHNTAVILDRSNSIAGIYRKMHIPDDPGYNEKYYFTPGDLGFKPVKTSVGSLGVLICWDQWFPEAARLMALAGADCLIYPTAIGWSRAEPDLNMRMMQKDAWVTIQRGHSIANTLPVFSINRVGEEMISESESQIFWGSSFATGTLGEYQLNHDSSSKICLASHDKEEILYAAFDASNTELTRQIWPFLRDRRIEGYKDLLSYGAS
ncbi:MAG: carbon-nitrogen hydrolase [Candidatus Caenarcaniphilales bacterium]|nr:carbon-nitrogen hydrolase [Candidatus Caenarcaniphilales bacterium]